MTRRATTTRATAVAMATLLILSIPSMAQDGTEPADIDTPELMAAPAFAWQRTDKLPGLAKSAKFGCPYHLEDAAFTPAGAAVLVGGDPFGCGIAGASSWRSGDGGEWEQEQLEKGQRGSGLVATDTAILAVGSMLTRKGSNAVVWTSEDGLPLTLAATIKDASFSDVLATPEGYEAVGVTKYKQGYGIPATWASTDGLTWGPPTRLGDKQGYPPVAAIGPSGVRLVADPARKDGALWRSEDGVAWEELTLSKEIRGKRDVAIWHLEGDESGFALAIQGLDKNRFAPQLWRSEDGRDWVPVAAPGDHITGLALGPLGQFAFTSPPSDKKGNFQKGKPGIVLWSADGSDWCRMASDDLARVEVSGSDVAPDGKMLLTGASGQSFTGPPLVLMGTPIDGQTVPCEPVAAPEGLPETITFTEPVVELPSLAAACADPALRDTSDTSMYCISDLISAGDRNVSPAKALQSAPSGFAKSGCVKPAGGSTQDRSLLCLFQIASSWRGWQREADADGMVTQKEFDKAVPMYQWAANSLSKADRQYLDQGLSKLDRLPLGWERPDPKKLKKPTVVKSAQARNTSAASLRKTLQKAWLQSDLAPIPDALVEMPGGWEQPDVPTGSGDAVGYPMDSMSYYLGPKGGSAPQTSLVTKCELAVDPSATPNVSGTIRTETCGRTAANAWLLYLTTGDERFIDVAVGIRDMALRAGSTEGQSAGARGKQRLFFETFDCWIGKGDNNRGCYSGI